MTKVAAMKRSAQPATRWRHRDIDGEWNRILPDGTLERRDPNDGQDPDPASKCRHQWRVEAGELLYRRLPPESVGDAWTDTGVPKWEPRDPRRSSDELLLMYYAYHAQDARRKRK